VSRDSAAAKAGLKAGDVITAIDGKSVTTPAELVAALPSDNDQHEVSVSYVRDKQQHSVKATIGTASSRNI
jgi:S1-C subfamily serine protease